MIRLIGSILALIALFRLWGPHYKILWWIILALFILDWLTGETVKTAVKDKSEGDVIRFWVWTNMGISLSCLSLSVIGIIEKFEKKL
jgi:lipoprotein signal peptidase